MSEEIITGIALAVAIFVGSITYKRKKGGLTRKQRFIENAKRLGNFTSGEYEGLRLHYGNGDSSNIHMRSNTVKVKYRYVVAGKTYYKTLTFQDPGKVSIDFPISVMVYYAQNNPKKALCPEEATKTQQLRSSCLVSMGVTVLTLAATFYFLKFILG